MLYEVITASYRDEVLPEADWMDSTVITNAARRMMHDWLPHRIAEEYALCADRDDRWRTGGSVEEITAEAGIDDFCNIDHAGDFGGVWYWNRYPGLQCDNDAYCYLPLLEETGFMPSKKFTDGWEIREYAQDLCRRYKLYENALFHTLVESINWDEDLVITSYSIHYTKLYERVRMW